MSSRHLFDPEVLRILEIMPDLGPYTDEKVVRIRENMPEIPLGDADACGVIREEIRIPSDSGGPDIRCLLYRPRAASESPRAGYLHLHGGGYILGKPEMNDFPNLKIASELGVVILSVDYRLAPEHPIPAPLDDAFAGLVWLHGNAKELGIDPARIGIGGESAGGGLAAAVAIRARDDGRFPLCYQHLTYPMLDDRTGSEEAPGDPLAGEFVWTRESNQYGWRSYLGDAPRAAPQVPARVESVEGLPRTWILTAALDLFRDENIDYARRLLAAGVPTDLLVYAGACHGFDAVPGTRLQRRSVHDSMNGLRAGLSIESPKG